MFKPIELYIGLRYLRAKRRNHFISFISLVSMVGIALGVTVLITVLSVMNGYEKELQTRILGITAHATLLGWEQPIRDWPTLVKRVEAFPDVLGAAPFVQAQGMVSHEGKVHGISVQGISPAQEPKVSAVNQQMLEGRLEELTAGSYKIIIGKGLADKLKVGIGDQILLIAPQTDSDFTDVLPYLRRLTVAGIFAVGMQEYDTAITYVHMEDAAAMFKTEGTVTGLRLKVNNIYAAPKISQDLVNALLPERYGALNWTQYHANFFKALKMQKSMMFAILMLIVAVAAFNVISTLVMVVTDKQADIAILRTQGLTPASVMGIFIVQGVVIGVIGTLLGVLGGVLLATHVDTLVPAIERFFKTKFLPGDVYYLTELPSLLYWPDVMRISLVAFVLCLLAAIYPAWRAARTQPAEVLRYE